MNQDQVENLISNKKFSHECDEPEEVIETHISWVFMCKDYAYKVKKPVEFDFLDFSTLDKRKFYCERELELNKRLASDIYLEVVPVTLLSGEFTMDAEGRTKDYAVKMKRMNPDQRMDRVLARGEVGADELHQLADKLATFHRDASVEHFAVQMGLKKDFESLVELLNKLNGELNDDVLEDYQKQIRDAEKYVNEHTDLFEKRDSENYIRDCHGDLHSENIFLLDEPIIFDCIEFNEDLRKIDILSEVAFLCMDMEVSGHENLSRKFIDSYNLFFPIASTEEEKQLFVFYKFYRAAVRAKINVLTFLADGNKEKKSEALDQLKKYFQQMKLYLKELKN